MAQKRPLLYERFLAEREEIMKHKQKESEKRGYEITFEVALTSWVKNYRKEWLKEYNKIRTNTPDKLGS